MKVHPVFHNSLLKPYTETMAHGPNFELPTPEIVEGECYDPDPIFHFFTPSSLSPRSPTPSATYPHPRDALPRTTVKVPSPLVHFPFPHAPAEPPATSDDLIKVRPFHSSHAAL